MSNADIPERWAKRLIKKGFTDARYKTDVASMSALASELGVHTSTVSNIIHGRTNPTATNVAGLVKALGADVADWLGVEYHGTWSPPDESALLDPRQRKALEELIVSITSKKAGTGDVAPAAKKTRGPRGKGRTSRTKPKPQ